MIRTLYTLVCDECDEAGGTYQNQGALRTESKANGWRRLDKSLSRIGWAMTSDYCPNCSEKIMTNTS